MTLQSQERWPHTGGGGNPTNNRVRVMQRGQKVCNQPLIVQVLLLRKMREVCNVYHSYTSTKRENIKKIKL